MFSLIIRVTLKPGKQDAFREIARGLIDGARGEAGCLSYDIGPVTGSERDWCWIERWRSEEALRLHEQQPHYLAGEEAMKGFFDGPAQVTRVEL